MVTLKNGQWEDRAGRIRVTFVRDFLVTGDLNADGIAEAAVLIAESGGGTGENIYLALVERAGTRLRNIATTLVGDRVQIRNGRTSGNMVILDVAQAGAADPLCCPGELATRAWRREGSALREEPAIATGRLSPSILAAETWTLRNWDLDTPSDSVPPITLRVQNGVVTGFAGCNTYRAPAR